MPSPDYDTTTGLRALKGDSLVADIDAGFLALATDVSAIIMPLTYAEVLTSQTTSSTSVTDLGTVGPSVTVTVPTNALVAIFAVVTMDTQTGSAGGARVDLLQDGSSLGQIMSLGSASPAIVTYTSTGAIAGITTAYRAGWFVFPPSAASHTYKLQYAAVTSGTAAFSNRKLWVRVLPF